MKSAVVFVQAVSSHIQRGLRPQDREVMAVFVEVLPLPRASEARTFSKSQCVQRMIGAGAGYEIFS